MGRLSVWRVLIFYILGTLGDGQLHILGPGEMELEQVYFKECKVDQAKKVWHVPRDVSDTFVCPCDSSCSGP